MASRQPNVLVVGAGIVGASVACHLARQGVTVTLIDRAAPANGVTRRSFAWINVSYGLPETYLELRHRAIGEWRRLDDELGGGFRIDWKGALTWHEDPAETERFARDSAAMGHDVRLVGRPEIAALEPNFRHLPDQAAFAASEGALDPIAATELLVEAAREAGAEVRLDAEILSLATRGSTVCGVETSDGRIEADTVVLASGVEAADLCRPLGLGLPLDGSPSILMRFKTPRRLVNRIVCNPELEIRPLSDTVMLGAEGYIDATGENGPDALAERFLDAIRRQVAGGAEVELLDVNVGIRPMPRDGLPLVGRLPGIDGLYVCVMHAGVILAPLAGHLAATEIASGSDLDLLAPYRPNRA